MWEVPIVVLWLTDLLCERVYILHTEGPAVLNFMLLVIWDAALCSGEFHSQLLLYPT